MTKYPKLRNLVTAGLLLLVMYIGVQAYYVYDGKYDTIITYAPPLITQDNFFIGNNQNGSFNVSLSHELTLRTTSLSAQNPIDVEMIVKPSDNYVEYIPSQWSTLPQQIEFIFPQATIVKPEIEDISRNIPSLVLIKAEKPQQYFGNMTIMYQFEGNYGYMRRSMDYSQPSKIGTSEFVSKDVVSQVPEDLKYHVDSSDVTNSIHTNNIFKALTLSFVGFSLIELREQIIKGFSSSYDAISKMISVIKSQRSKQEKHKK